MSKKPIATCALCLEERKLAHSHVWPEFFYTPMYDEDRRYISAIDEPQYSERPFQKGLREYLLCGECEAQLSRYETYAAGLIRRIHGEPILGRPGFELDYEYDHFKLFGVSLIWRSHIATSPSFRGVRLGPVAEDMRKMLLAADPGPVRCFPFALARIEGPQSAMTVMTTPQKTRFKQHHAYLALGLGLHWVFITARNAYDLAPDLPFVGFSPQLQIAVERTTEREFIQELRDQLPWLRARRA